MYIGAGESVNKGCRAIPQARRFQTRGGSPVATGRRAGGRAALPPFHIEHICSKIRQVGIAMRRLVGSFGRLFIGLANVRRLRGARFALGSPNRLALRKRNTLAR